MTTETRKNAGCTFVLVPGSWCGAWCWQPVTDRLRRAGHTVFPLSLTGLAERSHLLSKDITLETHVMDVINLIRYNDLHDVVLVGHSYAGVILSVVADRLADRLRHLVFLDALVPRSGECALDLLPDEEATRRIRRSQADGVSVPVPTTTAFSDPALREWFQSHMTPQPVQPYLDPVTCRTPLGNGLPATYVCCMPVHLTPMARSVERARRLPLWRVIEIASGHNVHLHRPDDVAALLERCGRA